MPPNWCSPGRPDGGRPPTPRLWRENARVRFRALLPIMLGFLAGTVVGMLAYVAVGVWGLLLPLAIMYAIFAWTSASALRVELE